MRKQKPKAETPLALNRDVSGMCFLPDERASIIELTKQGTEALTNEQWQKLGKYLIENQENILADKDKNFRKCDPTALQFAQMLCIQNIMDTPTGKKHYR